ncbi:MAG: hypothetical protein HUK02_04500 [Bacteroidaceae bacterium]|nr:hypothetical protein [Bacteroidaceae bacterium]
MRICLFLLALTIGWSAGAQERKSLVMSWSEASRGTQTATFLLDDIRHMTFNAGDGTVTLTTRDGATTTFAEQQLWTATFGPGNGPGEDGLRSVTSTEGSAELWTVGGVRLRQADSREALRLTDLPKGVYLVKSRGTVEKVKR